MPLTNAERQKRHRERLKAAASRGAAGLTLEQIADRNAVMAEPIWPTPTGAAREQMPTFLGWNRYDWSEAPEAMIDHFGMREAWEGWTAEWVAMNAKQAEISERALKRTAKRAAAIVEEMGDRAREILHAGGHSALIREYERDPTLGKKRRNSVT